MSASHPVKVNDTLFNKVYLMWGGPYRNCPDALGNKGFCLLEEPFGIYHTHLPVPDFGVPTDEKAVEKALRAALDLFLDGHPIYVGCMGGIGRTGMFMALIARCLGHKDPIAFIRSNYSPMAVETIPQEE